MLSYTSSSPSAVSAQDSATDKDKDNDSTEDSVPDKDYDSTEDSVPDKDYDSTKDSVPDKDYDSTHDSIPDKEPGAITLQRSSLFQYGDQQIRILNEVFLKTSSSSLRFFFIIFMRYFYDLLFFVLQICEMIFEFYPKTQMFLLDKTQY